MTPAQSGRGDPAVVASAWEESGRGFQVFSKEEACFELVGPQEQPAESDKKNRTGQGDPGGEGRGEAE